MWPPLRDSIHPIFVLFVLSFFLIISLNAHAIPLTGVSLRLVPKSETVSGVAPKIVEIERAQTGLRVKWFSLVKVPVSTAEFPTYKVRTTSGVLDVDGLSDKTAFFHPHLWGQGVLNLAASLPLWVSPEYLRLAGKDDKAFNLGLIDAGNNAARAAPDVLYERLLFFQNLFDHYFDGEDVNRDAGLDKADEKELKVFRKEFFRIGLIAKTKAKILVNKRVENVAAKILGNPYYQIVVLDDPANPLVISLRILTDKAPRVFQKSFSDLKRDFEFQVTQVNY